MTCLSPSYSLLALSLTPSDSGPRARTGQGCASPELAGPICQKHKPARPLQTSSPPGPNLPIFLVGGMLRLGSPTPDPLLSDYCVPGTSACTVLLYFSIIN